MEDTQQPQPPALVGTVVRNLTLPSGGHVVLRDPLELRAKDKRAVLDGINDVDRLIASSMDTVWGTIAMLVESWSIDYLPAGTPLPRVDISIIGELTIRDHDALVDAVGPAMALLFPRDATPDDAGRPGSPTGPAGG